MLVERIHADLTGSDRIDLTALRGRPDAEVTEMSKPADAHALMHAIKEKQEDR